MWTGVTRSHKLHTFISFCWAGCTKHSARKLEEERKPGRRGLAVSGRWKAMEVTAHCLPIVSCSLCSFICLYMRVVCVSIHVYLCVVHMNVHVCLSHLLFTLYNEAGSLTEVKSCWLASLLQRVLHTRITCRLLQIATPTWPLCGFRSSEPWFSCLHGKA